MLNGRLIHDKYESEADIFTTLHAACTSEKAQ